MDSIFGDKKVHPDKAALTSDKGGPEQGWANLQGDYSDPFQPQEASENVYNNLGNANSASGGHYHVAGRAGYQAVSAATDNQYRYYGIQLLENLVTVSIAREFICCSSELSYTVSDLKEGDIYNVTMPRSNECCECKCECSIPPVTFLVKNPSEEQVLHINTVKVTECCSVPQTEGTVRLNPDVDLGTFEGNLRDGYSLRSTSGDQLCTIQRPDDGCCSCQPYTYEVIPTYSQHDRGNIQLEGRILLVTFPRVIDIPTRGLLLSCAIVMFNEIEKSKKKKK